jgi:hypothetical protein
VVLTRNNGEAMASVRIRFRIAIGGGTIEYVDAAGNLVVGGAAVIVQTAANGVAAIAAWTLGPGPNQLVAEVVGLEGQADFTEVFNAQEGHLDEAADNPPR